MCTGAVSDGELAYITRRFDRLAGGAKVHQEDLLQISGQSPHNKYAMSYEEAVRYVAKAMNGKLAAKLDLLRRVVFSYVIGNDDLHMKNISLQRNHEDGEGYFEQLTPNYDVLFAQAFPNNRDGQFLACDLWTDSTGKEEFTEHYQRYGFYSGYDFGELRHRYGLPPKVVRKVLQAQIDNSKAIRSIIESSFMPDQMKHEASSLVAQRSQALEIGLIR